MRACLSLVAVLLAVPALRADEPAPVRIAVDPAKVLNPVDVRIYGHFLEHIYHSVNGGLWGEVVWNRSFEQRPTAGEWSGSGGEVIQSDNAPDVRRVFGSPDWTDYEFTCEARKDGGAEGFLILLRAHDPENFYWANLGGWGNARHALERGRTGERQQQVSRPTRGRIEAGRWYRIRARCEGPRIQVWLDDQLVVDFNDTDRPHLAGAVGLGTWSTRARFRNVKVAALDGTTLLEGVPPQGPEQGLAKHWKGYGPGQFAFDTREPYNSDVAQTLRSEIATETGLEQAPIAVKAGDTLRGSVWVRGSSPSGLVARLVDGETVLAENRVETFDSPEGRELSLELSPTADCPNATLQLGALGPCALAIDQVSLMPDSSRATGGFRPDLLEKVADLKAPVIRWPGGCFASPYRWKDGIGPQSKRKVYPLEIWDDLDVNSFGTDEFLALCRKVGTEPILVINAGTPQWNQDATSYDFLQDALDWIEYCNGPADSKWGAIRAANGHPEPYNVKYWEIDNETWGLGAETYAAYVKRFAPALRAKDPSIQLIMCGSGGLGRDRNGLPWNRTLIEQCADLVDYLSIHHYEDPNRFASGPEAFERFLGATGDLIKASRNPNLKIDVSEWNAQTIDWRTGLYAGGLLNAFERSGDVMAIGGPALFLRHVSATAWDNAFINFDHRGSFAAPNHVVMTLWRKYYQPHRIAAEGETGSLNGIATRSEDGRTVVYKCVNPTERAMAVALTLPAAFPPGPAATETVAADLEARNSLDHPEAIRPEPATAEVAGQEVRFTAPAHSAVCVSIRQR